MTRSRFTTLENPLVRAPKQFGQSQLAGFKRFPTQVPAIDLKQVERAERGAGQRAMTANAVEDSKPVVVAHDGFAVYQA